MKIAISVVLVILIIILLRNKFQKVDFNVDLPDGIQFHKSTFQQALSLAKTSDKPLFMDVYATWCGPCKMLKTTTFADSQLGEYMNNNFVNIAIDGEKEEGPEIIQKFNIRGFPTLLIINPDGITISRATGYKSVKELKLFAEKTLTSNNNN